MTRRRGLFFDLRRCFWGYFFCIGQLNCAINCAKEDNFRPCFSRYPESIGHCIVFFFPHASLSRVRRPSSWHSAGRKVTKLAKTPDRVRRTKLEAQGADSPPVATAQLKVSDPTNRARQKREFNINQDSIGPARMTQDSGPGRPHVEGMKCEDVHASVETSLVNNPVAENTVFQ